MIKFAPQEEKGAESVRQVGVGVDETDDSEYAFGVLGGADNPDNGEISVKIEGVQVTIIIDSGASCNVLDRNLWEYLKANKVRCASSKATKKLFRMEINSHCKLQTRLLQMC